MIIYQTQPNKVYPIIVQSFSRKYCNIYNYKFTFEFKNKIDEEFALKEEIILYPGEIKMIRDKADQFCNKIYYREAFPVKNSKQNIDFVHGIFSDNKLVKIKDEDFVFTFLDHPMNQIYNWYFYLKYVQEKIKFFLEKNIETYEGYSMGKFEEVIATYAKKFNRIEEFIDEFIYNKSKQVIKYKNKEFYFIDQIIHCSELKTADFYGLINTEKNLLMSINFLKKKLYISDLDFDQYKGAKILGAELISYRKNEIENILEKDIEFFEQKQEELNDNLFCYTK